MMDDEPKGARFLHLYLRSDELLPDSPRMRRRVGRLVGQYTGGGQFGRAFPDFFFDETGLRSEPIYGEDTEWSEYFLDIEIRDFLDSITLYYKWADEGGPGRPRRWRLFSSQFR
jgi:hypothetical protein